MPGRLGRLWRTGARRAQLGEPPPKAAEAAAGSEDGGSPAEASLQPQDIGQRLEAAQRRLRQAIPPPPD